MSGLGMLCERRALGPLPASRSPGRAPGAPGSWGSSYLGETAHLPEDLVGRNIEITPRREDFVLVRNSGKPSRTI